jgi:uncharacterized glyoxalase superfamily protein PhnB
MPARSAKKPSKTTAKASPKKGALKVTLKPRPAAKAPAADGADAKLDLRMVTPLIVADGASNAIAWYKKVFGAKELSRKVQPDGKLMHAAIQIGDSIVMLADPFGPAPPKMMGVTLHIQAPTIERLWASAVANGATVELPLANQFWGDKYGQLRDPFGHQWSFGWPVKMTPAEKAKLEREAMQMMAAGQHP